MSTGKAHAQLGHAYLDAYLAAEAQSPSLARQYRGDSHGTKIALEAKSLNHLLRAKAEAEEQGIPCALITDAGHVHPPDFDGSEIITALGLGPARRSQIRSITKRFKLIP